MSEKQFYYGIFDDGTEYIEDYKKKEYYFNLDDMEELLNKQQALINALKKENKELKEDLEKGFDVPIPYVENSMRRLRAEHKVDEQQAIIQSLKEENEKLKITLSEYGVDFSSLDRFKEAIGYNEMVKKVLE